MASLKPIHNQTVLLGALMGIEVPTFIYDESPLPLLFEAEHQEEVTKVLHELKWLHRNHIYRVPASNGGKASAALAGEWSDELGRNRMTAQERGHESARLAGEWSDELQRDRMTAQQRGHEGGIESARLAGVFSEKLGRRRKTMQERGHEGARLAGEWSDELLRNRMTAQQRGHEGGTESARLAGEWSDELQRNRMTAQQRGHESTRLAGTFSTALGRERLTLPERFGYTELWVVFQHRASTALRWGPWMGARCEYSDGYLDGISRFALATGACQMSRRGHSGAAACAI